MRNQAYPRQRATPALDLVYRSGDVLVFGSENHGLPRSVLDWAPNRVVRIAIDPAARSLNLSSAVAIGLFEAVRRIGVGG